MADKDFNQKWEFNWWVFEQCWPKSVLHRFKNCLSPPWVMGGSLSQYLVLCPSLHLSNAFMGEAVPIENDSTVMVQTSFSDGHSCEWNEGRPSGNHGHCHLTTSYSEGQGCFLSCCFCVVTMEICFIKINQNCNRGTRKAKSRCSHKPVFPSQGRLGQERWHSCSHFKASMENTQRLCCQGWGGYLFGINHELQSQASPRLCLQSHTCVQDNVVSSGICTWFAVLEPGSWLSSPVWGCIPKWRPVKGQVGNCSACAVAVLRETSAAFCRTLLFLAACPTAFDRWSA